MLFLPILSSSDQTSLELTAIALRDREVNVMLFLQCGS